MEQQLPIGLFSSMHFHLGVVIGFSGSSNSELAARCGIEFHPISSPLYIAYFQNDRIMSYELGAFYGTGRLFSPQLTRPSDLHFDLFTNSFLIVHYGVNSIIRYALDGTG